MNIISKLIPHIDDEQIHVGKAKGWLKSPPVYMQ
jgi:hypothetical protein